MKNTAIVVLLMFLSLSANSNIYVSSGSVTNDWFYSFLCVIVSWFFGGVFFGFFLRDW